MSHAAGGDAAVAGDVSADDAVAVAVGAATEDGATCFRIIAKTGRNHLGDTQISPGIRARVDVHTGTKPGLKLTSEAFGERQECRIG